MPVIHQDTILQNLSNTTLTVVFIHAGHDSSQFQNTDADSYL